MTLIPLFFAYAIAATTALYAARRLAPRDPLHLSALAIMLLLVNLMLPPTFAGLVGALSPLGLFVSGALVWSAEILLARRQTSLADVHLTNAPQPHWLRWVNLLGVALVVTVASFFTAYSLFLMDNLSSTDAIYHYVPNIINVVQSGSLFEMNGFLPYFPLGFEAILSWEIAIHRTFQHANAVHALMYLGGALYGILLLRWLLRDEPPAARSLGIIGGSVLLLTLNTTILMLGGTGKNDLLIWLCCLAGVYYLLRYWCDSRDRRYLVLIGITLGLALSSKLTTISWIAVFAIVHLTLLVREHRLRELVRDGLLVGLPIIAMFFPWGLRALMGLGQGSAPNLSRIGSENTFARQLLAPEFVGTIPEWLPWFIVISFSLALVLWLPKRQRSLLVLSAFVLLVSLTLLFTDRDFTLYQAGAAVGIIAGCMVLVWSLRVPGPAVRPLQITAGIVVLSTAAFAFSPFSACVTCDQMGRYIAILYRYAPATGALLCFALITLVVTRVTGLAEPHPVPDSAVRKPAVLVRFTQLSIFGLIIGIFAQQTLMPRPLPALLNALPPSTRVAPPLRDWIDENIRDSHIYSINEAPIVLYGRDLSNRVHYVMPGHEGYYGDQPYHWDDVQRLIGEYDLDYIVVKFGYIDIMQAQLEQTPDVMEEIQQLHNHLTAVYDNGTTVVFAVHAVSSGRISAIASVANRQARVFLPAYQAIQRAAAIR